MHQDDEPMDRDLWDAGWVLLVTLGILLGLTVADVWRASTWWASVSEMAAVSPLKTALILVLAPLVAVGTLRSGLRGPDAWRSGRAGRVALYVALVAAAFVGCVVLPGTDAGREFVTRWLSV